MFLYLYNNTHPKHKYKNFDQSPMANWDRDPPRRRRPNLQLEPNPRNNSNPNKNTSRKSPHRNIVLRWSRRETSVANSTEGIETPYTPQEINRSNSPPKRIVRRSKNTPKARVNSPRSSSNRRSSNTVRRRANRNSIGRKNKIAHSHSSRTWIDSAGSTPSTNSPYHNDSSLTHQKPSTK